VTHCVAGGGSTTLRGGAAVGGGVGGGTGVGSGGGGGSWFNGGVGCGTGVDCGASTLRTGAASGGDVVVWGTASPVSSVSSCCKAVSWLSVSRVSEDEGDGCWRARPMSLRVARIRSLEEARGILILVGNQEIVSDTRSA
jgi:hypothetical protein